MRIEPGTTLKEIAALINARFIGDENHSITGINEIHKVVPGDIVFVDHPKYYDKALQSAATTIIINKDVDCPAGKALLVSDDPFRDFNTITRHYSPSTTQHLEICHDSSIAESAIIYPNVTIGHNVSIGENTVIYPGVVIYDNAVIGKNVIIHANAVIGAHAFYYKKRASGFDKMHTCGRVVIEDDVEIGAASTIDSGVTGDTVIGEGSKIDNHVHIGHDTVVGKKCLFAAQVGIAGCVIVENNVTLWGQVGVPSGITIGEGAVVLGQSGLMSNAEAGKTYFGSPASEHRSKYRELAALRQLPDVIGKLKG
ncbi:MAG: UDP-3-O-(3-hydroxymyristoyl)glucosamine N-acyltransferase [Flavobacteriales bacterium]|nr:UDP-3-O-(3-hydroxymyristoyl)glucosamine N-acyltransferase [Flavobacteriales bacterium]